MSVFQGTKRKASSVGEYRLTGKLLGKGNFARVEEAFHRILDVKVAVKIIDMTAIKEKYIMKNLYREARVMSTLHHPCIVSLFQTMQLTDDVYYLVTELVSGGDLCSFITGQRFGKLEERPARIYARQFVSALSHMFSYGVVHRDLKMENVMLNAAQTLIKIVDFGLSNVWTSDSPLRTHCGSPEYAAPELFVAGREYGPEVDLWSLGIIVYGMVVGQLPFVSNRHNQLTSQERRKRLLAQINKGMGVTQRHAISSLSPEFRAMMNRLLVADPAKRISINQLIIHPWITEKGKKTVQIHPLTRLEPEWQNKLTRQISDLYDIEQRRIAGEIMNSPHGRFGGMYNILAYKYFTEHFSADLIATTKTGEILSLAKGLMGNKPKSAPAKNHRQDFYDHCVVLLNKVPSTQVASTTTTTRPKTALPPSSIATKTVRVAAKSKANKSSESAKKDCEKVASAKKAGASSRVQSAAAEVPKRRTKSDPSATAKSRPMTGVVTRSTTTAAPGVALKPPLKRSSVSPATRAACMLNTRESSRRVKWERNPLGMGDVANSGKSAPSDAVSQRAKQTDPLVNDPIARSIAGYLIKNVPDKVILRRLQK